MLTESNKVGRLCKIQPRPPENWNGEIVPAWDISCHKLIQQSSGWSEWKMVCAFTTPSKVILENIMERHSKGEYDVFYALDDIDKRLPSVNNPIVAHHPV